MVFNNSSAYDNKKKHTIQLSFLIGCDGMMNSAKLVTEICF